MTRQRDRIRRINAKRPPEVRVRYVEPTPDQEDELVRIIARLLDRDRGSRAN